VTRIRHMARPALAALALVGFLSWVSFAVNSADAAAARGAGRMTAATALSSMDPVAQAGNQLTTGCNQITEAGLPVGGKVSDWITQHIQPSNVVVAVWHYDNASQSWKAAFFNNPAVPVDVPTFSGPVDAFFVCVSGTATAP
jgi:hypothetical protein